MNRALVSVCIITYNHEKFIAQAIEGVLMQQVNFEYEIIIADDYSTDNTRNIINAYCKDYPNKIEVIFQKRNVGPRKNWIELITAPKTKYIAYFEGDDYWVDPCKLQKQVDFLEKNSAYSLCTCLYHIEKENKIDFPSSLNEVMINGKREYEITIDNFLNPYVIKTVCVMFRRNMFNHQLLSIKHYSDLFIWADLLTKGKGVCLNFVGGVYRLHNAGIWSGLNNIGKATQNYYLAKGMESTFNYQYQSLTDFRINQEHNLYTLLKGKKRLPVSEKKLMIELFGKKVIAKSTKFFKSIFSSNK